MATSIDLSQLPSPAAIEVLSSEALQQAFLERFTLAWEEQRSADPTLPIFDVQGIAGAPVSVLKRVD
ncbi:MAG TPA: baseplate assembly protein, partial [Tianweitania sediminis]|nr:baseplate assembly protein [Tianweitania sediminis]